MGKKLTEEERQRIKDEYMQHMDNKRVASELGISRGCVSEVTKEIRNNLILECPICGRKFKYVSQKIYCSPECWKEAYSDKKKVIDSKNQREHAAKYLREKKKLNMQRRSSL